MLFCHTTTRSRNDGHPCMSRFAVTCTMAAPMTCGRQPAPSPNRDRYPSPRTISTISRPSPNIFRYDWFIPISEAAPPRRQLLASGSPGRRGEYHARHPDQGPARTYGRRDRPARQREWRVTQREGIEISAGQAEQQPATARRLKRIETWSGTPHHRDHARDSLTHSAADTAAMLHQQPLVDMPVEQTTPRAASSDRTAERVAQR